MVGERGGEKEGEGEGEGEGGKEREVESNDNLFVLVIGMVSLVLSV